MPTSFRLLNRQPSDLSIALFFSWVTFLAVVALWGVFGTDAADGLWLAGVLATAVLIMMLWVNSGEDEYDSIDAGEDY